MRFTPGRSGNPAGMKVGTRHRTTAEVRAIANKLFDKSYWEKKYIELHTGTCNPKIEAVLLSYAFGQPCRELHTSGTIVHLGPLQALRQEQDILTEPTTVTPRRSGEPH